VAIKVSGKIEPPAKELQWSSCGPSVETGLPRWAGGGRAEKLLQHMKNFRPPGEVKWVK
jgi:hypothetical protein